MSPDSSAHSFCVKDLELLFSQTFQKSHQTRLQSGALEPFYQPAQGDNADSEAIIFSTRDYFASALHEISHWCIAGKHRRSLEDYGYWYEPDGRDAAKQAEFEQVEAKPQALECLFSRAAGAPFRLSFDNVESGRDASKLGFAEKVFQQYHAYLTNGLPPRAEQFAHAVNAFYGGFTRCPPADLKLEELI